MTKGQLEIVDRKVDKMYKILNTQNNLIIGIENSGTGFAVHAVIRALREIAFECLFEISDAQTIKEGCCDCEDFEKGYISNYCPVHNENPYPKDV